MNAFVCKLVATAVGAAIGQILFNKYEDKVSGMIDDCIDGMKDTIGRLKERFA